MNDQFEKNIDQLPLRKPSNGLDGRMQALFDSMPDEVEERVVGNVSGGVLRFPYLARGLSMAAMIGIVVILFVIPWGEEPVISVAGASDNPTDIVESWSNITPGEMIEVDENIYVQPIQFQTLERRQTINYEKNMNTEAYTPRNEILLVPVHFD